MKPLTDKEMLDRRNEHEAWVRMCRTIQKHFNITNEEFNKEEHKEAVAMIERWAYYDRLRRNHLKETEKDLADDKGLFWSGD